MPNIDELLRRQKALGEFGDFVLDHDDLQAILDEGCRLVAKALDADLAKVLEIERASGTALVRAGVGWRSNIVGKERISLTERSSEAFAIEQGEPVITNDIARETRFHFPSFLLDHGVVALVNVPIFLPGREPWGVLQVDAREKRAFEREDIEFLKTYAMVLGPVVDRLQKAAGLRGAETRLRTLIEGIPQLVWRSSDDGCWTWSSPQWQAFTGQDLAASTGHGWLEAVHPDDRDATQQAWASAPGDGGLDVEFRLRRASDGAFLWHHARAVPVRDDDGRTEWLGTTTDVQQLKALQEQQAVLVAELQHRTRNLMAVVRSIADKTARSSADLPDFRLRFRDRLDALARVQGLLSRLDDSERVTFDELVRTELAAMDASADRVTVEGPPGVRLRSSTVQALALALHELATNAVKYGALGQPAAHLSIRWSLEAAGAGDKPWLHIDWRESGVDMLSGASPRGSGQGRDLIERALPYQLSARTSYTLGPEGVHCAISIPVSVSKAEVPEHA